MSFSAKIVADSISPAGSRIVTMAVTFPAEALPQMRFSPPLSTNLQMRPETVLAVSGVAMQIGLAPPKNDTYSMVLTTTEWLPFFDHHAHGGLSAFHLLVQIMKEAYDVSTPQHKEEGDWHLPFIGPNETFNDPLIAAKVSAARCARLELEKTLEPSADLLLHYHMNSHGYTEPMEHVATPFTQMQHDVRGTFILAADLVPSLIGEDADKEVREVHAMLPFRGGLRGWNSLARIEEGE